jgi:hypothetical protein
MGFMRIAEFDQQMTDKQQIHARPLYLCVLNICTCIACVIGWIHNYIIHIVSLMELTCKDVNSAL